MGGKFVIIPFAKASQVRTDALNSLILGVSMFLSNEGASKVLALLGVKVSNDTVQRLYGKIEFVDDSNIEEVYSGNRISIFKPCGMAFEK